MKRILWFLLLMVLLLPALALAELEVRFLDVGQGDCAFVLCDGEAMVIDGGPQSGSRKLYSYRGTEGRPFSFPCRSRQHRLTVHRFSRIMPSSRNGGNRI